MWRPQAHSCSSEPKTLHLCQWDQGQTLQHAWHASFSNDTPAHFISVILLSQNCHCLGMGKGQPHVLSIYSMNRVADEVPYPDMLILIDEAACNRRASRWARGWSLVGRRCVQRQHFIHGQRFSILPILTLDGIIIYDIIPESVDSRCFVQFLRELVVCFFSLSLCLKSV